MGTDIHLFVEKRVDGKWLSCDKWTIDHDPYYGPEGYKHVDWKESFYSDRNYDVFAMLADVRNGSGFAGVDTGDGFNPIAYPKGYPNDMSPEVKAYTDKYTEHTPTWISLKELLEYDWYQITKHRGVVGIMEYYKWVKDGRKGEPYSSCGSISGPGVRHVSHFEMDEIIKNLPPNKIKELEDNAKDPKWGRHFDVDGKGEDFNKRTEYYTSVSWEESYKDAAGNFYTKVIPKLKAMNSSGNPEDIRLVFYFDS
jgi:hypothetical protein